MNVSAPFIVRPIATTLLMIGVTLLGSSPISFRRSWGCPRSTSRYSGVGEPAELGCLPPSQDGSAVQPRERRGGVDFARALWSRSATVA
jgi:hypothetical protein